MTVAIKRSNDVIIKIDSLIPKVTEVIEPHDFDQNEFDVILEKFRGLGRGDAYQQYLRDSVAMYSLAEMFARRVAGKHNKNVIFILFGDLGSGKSMALLKLALSCAMWLAALQKGKVQDYFRFSNIAVIDPEMLQEKLANLIRYNIYILDDAGPGYDARTFMSKSNRDLNYILQTCRTMNNILLISAPHGAMLDVTIHRLAQYYGEVSEVRHDIGISFIKVFRLIRVYREGKIFYVYMQKRNISARRYYTDMPPKALKDKYDIVREEQAAIIAARKAEREAAEGRETGGQARADTEDNVKKYLGLIRERPDVKQDEAAIRLDVGLGALKKIQIAARAMSSKLPPGPGYTSGIPVMVVEGETIPPEVEAQIRARRELAHRNTKVMKPSAENEPKKDEKSAKKPNSKPKP